MVPALIGAAVSAISAGAGAASSAIENKKAREALNLQKINNKKWFDMKMAEDYSSRLDNQVILNKQRDLLNEQYKRARATNKVAGGTEQSLAIQHQSANQTLSDTMASIAARSSEYKENVETKARQVDSQLTQQEIAMDQQQATENAKAASLGVQAGLNLIGSEIGNQTKVPKVKESSIPQEQLITAALRKGRIQGQTQQQMLKEAEKMNKINVNPFNR